MLISAPGEDGGFATEAGSRSFDIVDREGENSDATQQRHQNLLAALQNNSLADSGAVYFSRDQGSSVTEDQNTPIPDLPAVYIKAPNAGAGDLFGEAMGLFHNDLFHNNQGETLKQWSLAIGAPGEDSNGSTAENNESPDAGAVYIFSELEYTPNGSQELRVARNAYTQMDEYKKAFNSQGEAEGLAGDKFGSVISSTHYSEGVAISAPYNNSSSTGISPVVTDNPGNQQQALTAEVDTTNSGAVYLFRKIKNHQTQQVFEDKILIKANTPQTGALFGSSIATEGPLIAIGSPGEKSSTAGINPATTDDQSPASGAVDVYISTHRDINQQQYDINNAVKQLLSLKAPVNNSQDQFGKSVQLIDLPAVEFSLIVGAPGDDSKSPGSDSHPALLPQRQENNELQDSGAVFIY